MTPLDQSQKGPRRGKAKKDHAKKDHANMLRGFLDGDEKNDDALNNASIRGLADESKNESFISSFNATPLSKTRRARKKPIKKADILANDMRALGKILPEDVSYAKKPANIHVHDLENLQESMQGNAKTNMSAKPGMNEKPGMNAKPNMGPHDESGEIRKKRRRKRARKKQLNFASNFSSPEALPKTLSTHFNEDSIQSSKPVQKKTHSKQNVFKKDVFKKDIASKESSETDFDKKSKVQTVQNISLHKKTLHQTNIQNSKNTLPLYAALDLGTNNCRLLIATPAKPGHFRVVDGFSKIVRLGEGLTKTGYLSDKAMDRAIEALKICSTKLMQKSIRRQRLIATEACRAAKNGHIFIERVLKETGLQLEIINRETEARLAVSGCGTLVEKGTNAIVLFDIGGGSSEIALIDLSKKRTPRLAEHIIAWTSLPVGVVTLAEHYGGENVSTDDFAKMKDYVRTLLINFSDRHKLGNLIESPHFHLMGTSGTITTLAGIHLDLERYDRRQIDGIWMNSEDVSKMTTRLLSWNMAERVANPCIGQDRADLVLAGCAILEAIREIWPSERLRVADRGLREGILTELMSRDGAWRRKRYPFLQKNRIKGQNGLKEKDN